jgi:hypothetical protein
MRRSVIVAAMVGISTATVVSPAAADHTHVRQVGNGACVVLAEGSGEAGVQLPHQEDHAEDRRHPLHVKVHLGAAGTRGGDEVVWVKGSEGDLANCARYVNR